jgi:predicted DNA-binding transcriptional regulator AlpA
MEALTTKEIKDLERQHRMTPLSELEAAFDKSIAKILEHNKTINYNQPQLLKKSEAMKILGLSRKTFDLAITRNQIKTINLGGSTLIPRSEIKRLTQ